MDHTMLAKQEASMLHSLTSLLHAGAATLMITQPNIPMSKRPYMSQTLAH